MPPPSCTARLDGAQDRFDRARIGRPAREGAVEIDDVQPVEAGFREGFRLRRRIVVEDCRLRHVALPQAHAAAFLQIDGGKEDHGRQLQEVGDQREAEPLALLGMELRARDVVARHHGGDGAAMIGFGDEVFRICGAQMKGMHEIGVPARLRSSECRQAADARGAIGACSSPYAGSSRRHHAARSRRPRRRSSRGPEPSRIRGRARP